MSNIAEPQSQPQSNPDSQGPSAPAQAPAPEVQTRISLAVTPAPTAASALSTEGIVALDHDDRSPSQATAIQQHHQQLQLDSEHSPIQLHHHVDGSTLTSAQSQNQNQNQLEAANIAHFDALGHDFDKQNPFSAEFADRLARALRRLSSRSAGPNGSDVGGSLVVLEEDTTSVLDYACGSGTCLSPSHFASAWRSDKKICSLFLYACRPGLACARTVCCPARRRRYQPAYGRSLQYTREHARS